MKRDVNEGSRKKYILMFALLVLIFAATAIVSRFFVQVMLIQGHSMEPTYGHLSLALVDKRTDVYKEGDVIAFRTDKVKGVLVKRIVACEGAKVHIADGRLYVNGLPSKYQPENTFIEDAGLAAAFLRVPEGCFFVLGDNYQESTDSRFDEVGFVYSKDIVGRVLQ